MSALTDVEKLALLNKILKRDHPGVSVELGENWELIAEIFYEAGYDEGYSDGYESGYYDGLDEAFQKE